MHSDLVSIGIPVYNSESYLINVLESVINQTYNNIEIVISDNNSTDNTYNILYNYSIKDRRIKLYKQDINIGAFFNFEFVLKNSTGEYFMWWASDDIRSLNFIESNLSHLKTGQYIAATSYYSKTNKMDVFKGYSLLTNKKERIKRLLSLEYAISGGHIFYSMTYRNIALKCYYAYKYKFIYTAADWAYNIRLAEQGRIYCDNNSYTILGSNGVSSKGWSSLRRNWIEYLIPLTYFNLEILDIVIKYKYIYRLILLNLKVIHGLIKSIWHESNTHK